MKSFIYDEAGTVSQVKVSCKMIARIKFNNHSGSEEAVCNVLSDVMHKDSEELGDRAYGNVTPLAVKLDSHWTSKTLDYHVKVEKYPEETALLLIRTTYEYE